MFLQPDNGASTITHHESHHDQRDYDSNTRTETVNQIPQLSPFLMSQLQKRLELESKVCSNKQYI